MLLRLSQAPTFVVLLSAIACRPTAESTVAVHDEKGNGAVHITIVGLNDAHENLAPTNISIGTREVTVGGFDTLKGYLNIIRAQNRNTIVLAAGNLFPSPLEANEIKNEMMVGVLNSLDITAATFGEQEMKADLTKTGSLISALNFPLLLSNLKGDNTRSDKQEEGSVADSVTVELNGIKVGIIGTTLTSEQENQSNPVRVSDPKPSIISAAAQLRSAGVNVVTLMMYDRSECDLAKTVNSGSMVCLNGDPVQKLLGDLPENTVDAVFVSNSYAARANYFRGIPVAQSTSGGLSFDRIDLWVKRNVGVNASMGERVIRSEIRRPEFLCQEHFQNYSSCDPTRLASYTTNAEKLGMFVPPKYDGVRVHPDSRPYVSSRRTNQTP